MDQDMVQSLSGIGQQFEVNCQLDNSDNEEEELILHNRKSKEECEYEYKTLFLGGLIEKITKKSYAKIRNDDLQVQEGMENFYFDNLIEIKAVSNGKVKVDSNNFKKRDEIDNFIPPERVNVENVDMVKWEDEIVWEDDSRVEIGKQSYSILEELSVIGYEHNSGNWGMIHVSSEEEAIIPLPKSITITTVPLSNSILEETPFLSETSLKKKRKYRKKKKFDSPQENVQVSPNKLIDKSNLKEENLQFLNTDLLNCDWLDEIYWDDNQPKPNEEKLILDLNDKSMIYDIDLEIKDNDEISVEFLYQSSCNQVSNRNEIIPKKYHVQHSKPAIELDSKYYNLFPKGKEVSQKKLSHFKKNESIRLNYSKPKRKIKSIQSRMDLSAVDNQLVLMEFLERSPSLINKFGMATNIVNYCKKPETFQPIPINKNGITIMVDNEDEIPLLTNLESNDKIITAQNNMYSSQIYEQKVKNSDFLLCQRTTTDGRSTWFIREIPNEYLVGHIQPQIEVYPPRTRSLDSYINNALSYHICKFFKDKIRNGKKAKISVKDITSKFDDIPRQTIREKLKEFATLDRKGNVWVAIKEKLPTDEELQRLVTPEMICVNESMILGDYKFNRQHIDDRSDMVAYELSYAKLEDKYRKLINAIQRIKNNLPWEQTSNFQLCFKSNKENVKLELLELVQQNVKNVELFVSEINKQIEMEAEEILPSLTDSQARKILIDSKLFQDETISNMSRSERKFQARTLLKQSEEYSKVDSELDKRSAKTLARINVFKDALRDVYWKESIKLSNGLNFYETSEKEVQELILKKKGHRTNNAINADIASNDSLSTHSRSEILDENPIEENGNKKKRGRKKKISLNNQYVKKTTTLDDKTTRVEYIHNPVRVNYYQQVQKSKRRSKHLIGAQDCEILSVGPRERARLQALSKEFKKNFNSTADKEEAIERLFRKSEKINTSIKNASSSSSSNSSKNKRKSQDDNNHNRKQSTSIRQPRKKTKIH
ncbi:predicted protein [Naegleria gruberi]|uniref:Predicted protein n=1 Tax=Naegleria gruberi TaxID=5762 RepID=D2VE13_NAEGR|nr:uncharacterized protein NAEGRDRAFT_48788 [Naegleria gruberi]EFC45091.1 predicted protein [Naegleria gruberi]|eukprot:XP_002677835.1 predicted protein [Naegleria gruberi strain NEG-M]